MEPSDADLWVRSRAGDRDAFGTLFERYARLIYNYCFRRVGSWATAEPAQTTNIPANSGYPANGVPAWITGSAISPTVTDVVIRFSDGSSVHPHIVWVSAPINAGFFAYDIPSDRQSSQDHVTAIEAYDQNGKLVTKETGLVGG